MRRERLEAGKHAMRGQRVEKYDEKRRK